LSRGRRGSSRKICIRFLRTGLPSFRPGFQGRWPALNFIGRGAWPTMKFRVVLQQDEDGVFVAEVPSLPGCISQGATRQAALDNIREAIEGYLESLKQHGEPIPPPIDEEVVDSRCLSTLPSVSGREVAELQQRGLRIRSARWQPYCGSDYRLLRGTLSVCVAHFGSGTSRSRQILRARKSSISRCRGMVEALPLAGLT